MLLFLKNRTFANVKELQKHIEILLLTNDCVVIPGLGGFVAHYVEARYDENDGVFLPPMRTLGFNPQLTMNDSLLAQSYVEAYDISYPEALRRIEKAARQMQNELDEHGEYELYNIGRLIVNANGKMEFSPCEAGILTPELYGLSSFEMTPIRGMNQSRTPIAGHAAKKARIISIDTDGETGQKRVSISMKALRNTAVAAVLVVAFMMVASPLSNNPKVFTTEKIKSSILYNILDLGKTDTKQMSANAMKNTAATDKKQTVDLSQQPWSIVLCTHVTKENAKIFINQLAAEGVQSRLVINSKGTVKVLYGGFATEAEAHDALRTMRTKNRHFEQGWVTNN